MSSPTSWMPFWLAATWARRSDRLSCRFRVPLQPVILPGARRASVTARWMESPLSYPPSPEAALPCSTPAAPLRDTVGPHTGPSLAPHTLLTPSVPPEPPDSFHLLKFLLPPQAHPHTDTSGWGRGGGSLLGQTLLPPSTLPGFSPHHFNTTPSSPFWASLLFTKRKTTHIP